jgi:hypothetical protein
MRWASGKRQVASTDYVLRFTFYVLRFLPPLLFFLLLLTFFHKMAFSNLILARGDTFLYFYPYWQMAAEALRDGRIPLWNPHLFMGSPFLANSQVGFFYPLNWPLWWLLETPYAVSASILLHLGIAGMGAYLAGRKALRLDGWAALVTAVLFALGGYVTAQVEHINQLQGMAWLPWYLVVIGWCAADSGHTKWAKVGWGTAAFAILFSLQLLAGHTQTAFISSLTLLLWLTAAFASHLLLRTTHYALRFTFHWQRLQRTLPLALLFGGLFALLLTAVQLLPTLELTQYSSRQGGLPPHEVLSFSLHPLLLTHALLPAYGQALFSEYVAFLPLTAVILALIGAWQWRRWPGVLPALVLVVIGLLLAFGVFNPGYWVLARLPVFNLFRVPARWLLVYTLGMALLAGAGFQVALDCYHRRIRRWEDVPERAKTELVHIERPLRAALYLLIAIMLWNALAGFLAIFIPTGPESPFESTNFITLLLWLVELLLAYWLLTGERVAYDRHGRFKVTIKRSQPRSPFWLLLIIAASLFLASRTLSYNNLTTPEAYFDLRPPITRLQVAGCKWQVASGQVASGKWQVASECPSDRFLSLSNIFFGVGDQAEIDTIYADQLPEAARYDYTVAIKHKEVIGPNLPMAFGLASVDGFDGGILPLRSYSELMGLILPEGVETTDGRLREHLTAVPPARWLDLFNARYLITDKTGDLWLEGVPFDLQHQATLPPGTEIAIGWLPHFSATELQLVVEAAPGEILVDTAEGQQWQLTAEPVSDNLYRALFPQTAVAQAITLTATIETASIQGLTLVNSDKGTFYSLVPGQYRLIHSGDVKIYENLDVLPRAFMVHDWQWQPDIVTSIEAIRDEGFVVGETAVLIGEDSPSPRPSPSEGEGVEIRHDAPERIVLQTQNAADGLLLLTEAFYPGWQARVDGEPATIYRADGYFQAVFVPAGEHEVVFEFKSLRWEYGRILSLIGLFFLLMLISVLTLRFYGHRERNRP